MGDVKDKVLVITGGTFGIGEGCVRELTKVGAKVVFCGKTVDKGRSIEQELSNHMFLFSDDAKTVMGANIYPDYAYACGDRYDQLIGLESMENAKNILDEC
jgi:NAD(P)-dependent dehydrogenase (short-subunit alcohol dehydrogenase family)